jgi:hypothetical protein
MTGKRDAADGKTSSRVEVRDYTELDKLDKREGLEATVLSTGIIYRVARGHWKFVGPARGSAS